MGLFSNLIKKRVNKAVKNVVTQENPQLPQNQEQTIQISIETEKASSFHEEEYREALRRYDEAHSDTEYQEKLTTYFSIIEKIQEMYSVLNNVGSFSSEAGNKLISDCFEAISIENDIREKREYYDNMTFDMSTPCKTLSMIFEKREEYEKAACICVSAIEKGYHADGTKGGMRGRLARIIKKGNLPLSDNMKKILNI